MPVNTRWVNVNGQQLLLITLPGPQYVTVDTQTAWHLLLHLRAAMRRQPPKTRDNR